MILPCLILASAFAVRQPIRSSYVYGPPADGPVRYAWGVTDDPSEGDPADRLSAAWVFVDVRGDGSGVSYGPASQAIPYIGDRSAAIAANDAYVRSLNGERNCVDFNGDGSINSQDFYDFLTAFYAQGGTP